MNIQFSKAKAEQSKEIFALYQPVIDAMHLSGLKQWNWEI